jgi:hypothetical protein
MDTPAVDRVYRRCDRIEFGGLPVSTLVLTLVLTLVSLQTRFSRAASIATGIIILFPREEVILQASTNQFGHIATQLDFTFAVRV